MLLQLENIKKSYKVAGKRRTFLDDIDLGIDTGEIVSITGKSGCGKTTLLNVIAGIATPDSGRIYSHGKKLRYGLDLVSARRRNRDMGFIFQTFKLIPNASVMANVLLPARIRGKVNREIKMYAEEVLGKLQMYKFRNNKAGILSGGQKQRVSIARALVNSPSIILADEPTANLDKKTSIEIFTVLEELKREGKAILIVTHKDYMHERSDVVYTMVDGKLKVME
ncbi:MAG: ABC transporter ATP-binding protein [bacterium]|nr:ABC transporter ATP-binding protein [bacterium]